MKVDYTFKHLMRMTEHGERPYTDVFMQYEGRDFYSRYHGTLSHADIKTECKLLEQRLKKEGK